MNHLAIWIRALRQSVGEFDPILAGLDLAEAEVAADATIMPEEKARQLETLRAKAQADLDRLKADVAEASDAVTEVTGGVLQVEGVSDAAIDRAWARALRQLDAGVLAADLVASVVEAGDVATLMALRLELVPYLVAHAAANRQPGQPARPVDEEGLAHVEAIDRGLVDVLPAEESAAVAARLESRDLLEVARTRLLMVQRRILGTYSPGDRIAAGYASADLANQWPQNPPD